MTRFFTFFATACISLAAVGTTAEAQTWPTRPVRMVVPTAPGGPVDTAARIIGEALTKRLGATFIVENRAGAGGNIGADYVAKAAPDGTNLLFATTALAIAPGYYKSLPYDVEKDLVPISLVSRGATVLVVPVNSPLVTVDDLLRAAKEAPGKLTFGSSGNGTTNHLAGELLMAKTGIRLLHIPYTGASFALNNLLGGQIDMMFASAIDLAPRIKAGQVRALAITNGERSDALPGVPTIGETVPGYECSIWYGLFAPKGTSPDILRKISTELAQLRGSSELKVRFEELGARLVLSPPEVLASTVQTEVSSWRQLIRSAGIGSSK